jgi:hypothetical protein
MKSWIEVEVEVLPSVKEMPSHWREVKVKGRYCERKSQVE